MRLDEWLVKQGLFTSRSRAHRFIRNNGVSVNKRPCIKPAYLVKQTDNINLDKDKLEEFNKPLGYQKLKYFVNQLNIKFYSTDSVLDIGASAGGFCQFILEQNIKQLHAIEISPQFEPNLKLLEDKNTNFSYHIKDIFSTLPTLRGQKYNLVTIDLTVDPIFLLDQITLLLSLVTSSENPARVLCMIKIENPKETKKILNEYDLEIRKTIQNINQLIFLDSLPEKNEKAMYLEFWINTNKL